MLGAAAEALSACYTRVLRSQLLMGREDGRAGQPTSLALTSHAWDKSAGLEKQLWGNKLPGLSSEENPWTSASDGGYFDSSTAGADITIKSDSQRVLVLENIKIFSGKAINI